jgi:hypothetical protein
MPRQSRAGVPSGLPDGSAIAAMAIDRWDDEDLRRHRMAVIAFSRAASEWEAAHLFAARALKNLDPIPEDFADKAYWP